MRYIEKLRIQTQYDTAKGSGSSNIVNPQKLLEQEIAAKKQRIEEMEHKEQDIKKAMEKKEQKKQRVQEMENVLKQLQENLKATQEEVANLAKAIETKNQQISKTESDITYAVSEIKGIQNNINQQVLTTYEKEVLMQEIENLQNKKYSLEKDNATMTKEIHESNRELHVS